MAELSKDIIANEKKLFINSLENLNVKEVKKSLRLNILKDFQNDADFCPFQTVLLNFNSTFVEDFKVQQRLRDHCKVIVKLLIEHGADVNKVTRGMSVLSYQILELVSLCFRCNLQIFNILIENGAKLLVKDEKCFTYCYMMTEYFCQSKSTFWLFKKVILYGIYSLVIDDIECFSNKRGKRLLKSLPLVFILYCFKQRQIKFML